MAEMCVDLELLDESTNACLDGETLFLAILIECLVYIFLFLGGWAALRHILLRKSRVRLEKQMKNSQKLGRNRR